MTILRNSVVALHDLSPKSIARSQIPLIALNYSLQILVDLTQAYNTYTFHRDSLSCITHSHHAAFEELTPEVSAAFISSSSILLEYPSIFLFFFFFLA